MDNFYVYIIYSASLDKYYVGQTSHVENRLAFHNDLLRNRIWTKRGIPWELQCSVGFRSRSEAMRAERLFKSKKSRKFIDDIIEHGFPGSSVG
jgi:putative endonuclease